MITLEQIKDKIELFEASDLVSLEKKIQEKIDANQALLLSVHSVSYQTAMHLETGKVHYSACVHFKANY
ncbi:DUF2536 family protein [Massilibacterium senegalense]|uniref:DUF2536 family protein n=1 Tax=Massilibacterium senegalense TaxID=1632858 RepID=UPI0007812FFD|nr:DUF2536 family protein [Massilibacterium senegalense]